MKSITIHKNRCPLEATAVDGIKAGTIKIDNEEDFICEAISEFNTCPFESVKLKRITLQINKSIGINKITIKEK